MKKGGGGTWLDEYLVQSGSKNRFVLIHGGFL